MHLIITPSNNMLTFTKQQEGDPLSASIKLHLAPNSPDSVYFRLKATDRHLFKVEPTHGILHRSGDNLDSQQVIEITVKQTHELCEITKSEFMAQISKQKFLIETIPSTAVPNYIIENIRRDQNCSVMVAIWHNEDIDKTQILKKRIICSVAGASSYFSLHSDSSSISTMMQTLSTKSTDQHVFDIEDSDRTLRADTPASGCSNLNTSKQPRTSRIPIKNKTPVGTKTKLLGTTEKSMVRISLSPQIRDLSPSMVKRASSPHFCEDMFDATKRNVNKKDRSDRIVSARKSFMGPAFKRIMKLRRFLNRKVPGRRKLQQNPASKNLMQGREQIRQSNPSAIDSKLCSEVLPDLPVASEPLPQAVSFNINSSQIETRTNDTSADKYGTAVTEELKQSVESEDHKKCDPITIEPKSQADLQPKVPLDQIKQNPTIPTTVNKDDDLKIAMISKSHEKLVLSPLKENVLSDDGCKKFNPNNTESLRTSSKVTIIHKAKSESKQNKADVGNNRLAAVRRHRSMDTFRSYNPHSPFPSMTAGIKSSRNSLESKHPFSNEYANNPNFEGEMVLRPLKPNTNSTEIMGDTVQRAGQPSLRLITASQSKIVAATHKNEVLHPIRLSNVQSIARHVGQTSSGRLFFHGIQSPVQSKSYCVSTKRSSDFTILPHSQIIHNDGLRQLAVRDWTIDSPQINTVENVSKTCHTLQSDRWNYQKPNEIAEKVATLDRTLRNLVRQSLTEKLDQQNQFAKATNNAVATFQEESVVEIMEKGESKAIKLMNEFPSEILSQKDPFSNTALQNTIKIEEIDSIRQSVVSKLRLRPSIENIAEVQKASRDEMESYMMKALQEIIFDEFFFGNVKSLLNGKSRSCTNVDVRNVKSLPSTLMQSNHEEGIQKGIADGSVDVSNHSSLRQDISNTTSVSVIFV